MRAFSYTVADLTTKDLRAGMNTLADRLEQYLSTPADGDVIEASITVTEEDTTHVKVVAQGMYDPCRSFRLTRVVPRDKLFDLEWNGAKHEQRIQRAPRVVTPRVATPQ